MTTKANFTIAYDGPSLHDGTMDVKSLAPALIAIGQLVDAANYTLNGETSKVNVHVEATSHGSFRINLNLVHSIKDQVVQILLREDIAAALTLAELLGLAATGGGTLIWLIKKLKKRHPDKLEKIDDSLVKLSMDGETIIVPMKLLRLYQDLAVRTALDEVVRKPLEAEGIDEFQVTIDGRVVETVTSEEAKYFEAPEVPEEVLLDEHRRAVFSIISLAFKEGNKWRLHDGNNQINALITDESFLRKVDTNSISFSKGDVLVCNVHIRQMQTGSGLKAEYIVEEVIEHKPAPRQISLNIEPKNKL